MTTSVRTALAHRFHNARAQDEGLALALALIFVLVMSLVVTALLPYTSTGLRAASAVRDVRTVQNAADGAVDEAINSIRGSFDKGASPSCASGGTFPTYTAADYPNPAPDTGVTKVRVEYCNDASSTGLDDQPPYAIQTLLGGVDVDGNAPLIVSGGVLTNGDVAVKGSLQSLNIQGDLYATGTCSAKSLLFVSGVQHCANTAPAYSSADPDPTLDPLASLPEPSLPPVVDPAGVCAAAAASVVTFSPGLYTQNPIPDPTTCTGPKHTVWWFQPGMYYFDFPDSTFKSPQFGNNVDADAAWSASGITIVAGTPANWSPSTSDSSDVEALFKNDPDHGLPACAEGSPGTVFAFGGPTSISIGTGGSSPSRLEICSGVVGSQHLSLYGLRNSPSRSGTPTPMKAVASTATAPVGLTTYVPAAAARQIDATDATATLVGGVTTSATVSLGAFTDISSTIPDGSIITAAQLRVNHWTTSPSGASVAAKVDNSVAYKSAVYPQTAVALPATTTQPALTAGTVVPLPLSGSPRWKALKASLTGLSVTFTADGTNLNALKVTGSGTTLAETATSHLDGVELEVSYIPPAIETTRCLPGVAALCSIITNKVDDTLFPHGSVYTPKSIVEAAVHSYSSTVFERGVLAGSMVIHVSASAKQTLPPFQLPRGSKKRVVRFTASSLEPDGTWRARVVALVQYDDFLLRPDGKTSASPGHVVTVLKWTVRR